MITDILAQLSILHSEVPEEEFEHDAAVEAAIAAVDRDVTDEERALLDDMLPEWLDDGQEAHQ